MARLSPLAPAACVAAALLLFSPPSEAGDFRLELGASGAGSEWRGDAAAYGSLELGYRFIDLVGIYGGADVGYATVDTRMLSLVTLGGQIWGRIGPVRPWLKLGFLHQHEESLSVVAGNYVDALFGIGDGIRHRAGGEAAIGADVPVFRDGDVELFASAQGFAKMFPDDLGPIVYAGGGLGLGMSYWL